MPAQPQCQDCGALLPSHQPRGLCPRCALRGLLAPALESAPAVEPPAASPEPAVPPRQTAVPSFPVRFGDYELLGEIARGGMGIVYRARQQSLNRTVALKRIAVGRLESSTAVQRFRAEAESAAHLDHPNIVPIYEIGEFAGQHFFTMKLVEGCNLAQCLAQYRLPGPETGRQTTTRGKALRQDQRAILANLVARIADAVHYAHQHGILHRDLKPGNILIDAAGQPHITDFGLAKRVEGEKPEHELTVSGAVMGTPTYMAPEQAAGEVRQMTTATDVYSLGVLLYELLTGRVPFRGASLLETLELVRHSEPTAPRALNPATPRDLETICLKCLEKDPAKRYGSAHELADELRRFLLDEPILARPVTQPERIWRWCRRQPVVASLGAAVVLLLVGLTVTATWFAFRTERDRQTVLQAKHDALQERNAALLARDAQIRERTRAEIALTNEARLRLHAEDQEQTARREATKSRQVVGFLEDMLKAVGPARARGRDTAMLRDILDKTASRVSSDLSDQPEVEADVRSMLGNVYQQLGDHQKAVTMKRAALILWKKAFGDQSRGAASALNNLALSLIEIGELNEAESLLRESLAIQRKHLSPEDVLAGNTLNNLASLLVKKRKLPEAEELFRQALEIRRKARGDEHPDIAQALNNLAVVVRMRDRLSEAEALCRQALALDRKLFTNDHPALANSLDGLGDLLKARRQWDEAEALLREALAIRRRVLGNEREEVAVSLNHLAELVELHGQFDEAEVLYREALAVQRKVLGETHHDVISTLNQLAHVLAEQRKEAEAETMQREALRLVRQTNGPEKDVALLMSNLGDTLKRQNKITEAVATLEEARALLTKQPEPDLGTLSSCLGNLGGLLAAQRKYAEAETILQESVTLREKTRGAEDAGLARTLGLLANVIEKQGRMPEGEPIRQRSLAMQRKLLPADHPHVLISINNLARLLMSLKKLPEAQTLYRELVTLTTNAPARQHWTAAFSRMNLGIILAGQNEPAQAEPLLREALQLFTQYHGKDQWEISETLFTLARVLNARQAFNDALSLSRDCLNIREKLDPASPATFEARRFLGSNLLKVKQYEEAERVLLATYHAQEQRQPTRPAELQAVATLLGKLYADQGNETKAAEWRSKFPAPAAAP